MLGIPTEGYVYTWDMSLGLDCKWNVSAYVTNGSMTWTVPVFKAMGGTPAGDYADSPIDDTCSGGGLKVRISEVTVTEVP